MLYTDTSNTGTLSSPSNTIIVTFTGTELIPKSLTLSLFPMGYTQDPDYMCNNTTEMCSALFPFHINSSSGEISIQSSLDYEKNTSWVFSVVGEDNGVMRLSDTATVTVVVDDVNDNSPIFDQAVYTADVEEEASMGMFVVIVTANDADSLPNAMITY